MIYNNAAWVQRFTLKSAGLAYPLTGKTLEMRIAERADKPSVIPISTTNGKIAILDGPGGVFQVTLTATDMENFQPVTHVFEVGWANSPQGYARLFGGRFPVRQGVPS